MPGGDRTGPFGMGPQTGRRAGYCAGFSVPGYMNNFFGFGRGGRGRRNCFWATGLPGWMRWGNPYLHNAPYEKKDQITFLKEQAKYLKETLENTEKQIQELENDKKE